MSSATAPRSPSCPSPRGAATASRIRLCEQLRDRAAIEQELRDLEDPTSARSLSLGKGSPPDFPATWRQRVELELHQATRRTLPPSCLHCSQRDVAYFTVGQWAPHPGTGEEVLFRISGMCSTDFAVKFYDLEGTPLNITGEERAAMWKAAHKQAR